ncbi:MAG: putative sulfate/molybdate transporter [Candidatus Thiodiazotropha sp. (ex Ustalcina ferruginea)]|nr:putative sulfate/molybdate transporter [Candidatus Thiodiazotropha sp. (ex Ustalcina ferruginea)]
MSRLKHISGELSGAFADLGTFLPIVIAVLTLQQIDPSGLFIGFGLFAIAVAVIYRRPIPIQPMKVVAAVVISQNLSAGTIAASGLLLGLVVFTLSITGVVSYIGKKIPKSVLSGVQLGVGLILAWAGAELMLQEPLIGVIAIGLLLLLLPTPLNPFAAVIVIIGASTWSVINNFDQLPVISMGFHLPRMVSIEWLEVWESTRTILLPQLSLTLTNAIIATAAIAIRLFPHGQRRITPTRLGVTTGALNLLLAPLGAFPMCHGAGGLVVQHRFGARTWVAPAIFGISCLSVGILLGPDALKVLTLIPLSAVGALLIFAGIELAGSKQLLSGSTADRSVIIITGIVCVLFNVALGLLVGLLIELFKHYRK